MNNEFFHSIYKLEAQPTVLDTEKAQTASVLTGLKNYSTYEMTGDKIVKIHQV